MHVLSRPLMILRIYRVVRQVVQHLLLTSKQKLCHSIASLFQNATLNLVTKKCSVQPDGPPCMYLVHPRHLCPYIFWCAWWRLNGRWRNRCSPSRALFSCVRGPEENSVWEYFELYFAAWIDWKRGLFPFSPNSINRCVLFRIPDMIDLSFAERERR